MLGKWPEVLWKQGKLTHDVYEEYIFLCRDGVLPRKRNLQAVREHEEKAARRVAIEERIARVRGNPELFGQFPDLPPVREWLNLFQRDALRYPILVVLGRSAWGKTEWAKSLFRNALEVKIGSLQHFPERMRAFDRAVHDGLILDDVRDLRFCTDHQEKLQGKYDFDVESTP